MRAFQWMRWAGAVTLAAACWWSAFPSSAAGRAPSHSKAPSSPVRVTSVPDTEAIARLSVPQAREALSAGTLTLVDVRPAPQRSMGHIRDDVASPLDEPAATLPADRKLVFYCSCVAEELALDAARAWLHRGRRDVAVLVGGFDAWREAGGPIAAEATWEEVFRVDRPPVAWGKTPVDSFRCRYGRDDDIAFSGRSSGRIGCLADTSTRGLSGLIQRLDASPALGRSVTLTAAVRGESVTGIAFLWVGAEDRNGKLITMRRAEQNPIRGSQEWHFVQVSGDVPPDAGKVLVGLSLAGAGVVWLDEVKLRVDEAGDLPARPLVVRNPGFED